jgi:hypothetical protein
VGRRVGRGARRVVTEGALAPPDRTDDHVACAGGWRRTEKRHRQRPHSLTCLLA